MLLYLALMAVGFYSAWRLYKAILAERPEWLQYKGEPSIFYRGLPRIADPNVNLRVLAVAFSGRARELAASDALRHAQTIRIVVPAGLLLFGSVLVFIFSQGAA
jgi:hypothetical protein